MANASASMRAICKATSGLRRWYQAVNIESKKTGDVTAKDRSTSLVSRAV